MLETAFRIGVYTPLTVLVAGLAETADNGVFYNGTQFASVSSKGLEVSNETD
jgi:hypothetical protein